MSDRCCKKKSDGPVFKLLTRLFDKGNGLLEYFLLSNDRKDRLVVRAPARGHGTKPGEDGDILADDLKHPHGVHNRRPGHTNVQKTCEDVVKKLFLVEDENQQMHRQSQ